jgi:hypothetical protein
MLRTLIHDLACNWTQRMSVPLIHAPSSINYSGASSRTTYLLTPWCRVLLEKLTGLQLVKKFPAFHGTRRFIAALTTLCHPSLFWASPIQSIYPHPTSWRSILILSTHLRLGLPSVLMSPFRCIGFHATFRCGRSTFSKASLPAPFNATCCQSKKQFRFRGTSCYLHPRKTQRNFKRFIPFPLLIAYPITGATKCWRGRMHNQHKPTLPHYLFRMRAPQLCATAMT